MAKVRFTKNLYRFFPKLAEEEAAGSTVVEVINNLEQAHPGFRRYILDDQGALRKHVNIFVGGKLIQDRKALSDATAPSAEVFFVQALSGG